MTTINVTSPYAMKAATLKIEADDYTAHVNQAEFQPSSSTGSWTGIGGNVIQDQSIATWTLALGLVQDDDATGLLRYLFDHEGEVKTIELAPRGVGGTKWTAEVTITPANIGGTASNTPVGSTVSLPVNGKPVPTSAA